MFDDIDYPVIFAALTVVFGLSLLGCLIPPCGSDCGGECQSDAAVDAGGSCGSDQGEDSTDTGRGDTYREDARTGDTGRGDVSSEDDVSPTDDASEGPSE